MKCPYCGQAEQNACYCENCGARLDENREFLPPQEVPQDIPPPRDFHAERQAGGAPGSTFPPSQDFHAERQAGGTPGPSFPPFQDFFSQQGAPYCPQNQLPQNQYQHWHQLRQGFHQMPQNGHFYPGGGFGEHDNMRIHSANSRASASLVFGILGFVFFCLAGVFGILAVILGASAKVTLTKAGAPAGTAVAGIVLGAISAALFIIFFISFLI